MKRRIKKPVKIVIALVLFLLGFFLIYQFMIGRVSSSNKTITYEVKSGSTFSSIADSLKENNLIKSKLFYRIYIKLNNPKLKEGTFELSPSMNVKTLVETLSKNGKEKYITITFKEGIDFDDIVDEISSTLKIEKEEIYNLVKDEDYLNSLIKEYWFLTDDIKNKDIYYPLEGYLFPDTYQVTIKSDTKDIFKMMLDNMEKKLEEHKKEIEKSKYSIHEIITMASIIEKEASNASDRKGVAGVFYNRLVGGWSLGSDVTTYYGLKLKLSSRDLTQADLNSVNGYNTRNSLMAGKLPVGPICIPSYESIVAAISPTEHDYYYFVADKTKQTYFSKNQKEHDNTIAKLKKEGKWFEY